MDRPEIWNHNAAYYPWVRRQLRGGRHILDVGCGEGSLVRFLAEPGRSVLGLDPDPGCIGRARSRACPAGVGFTEGTLEDFSAPAGSLDGVVFSASLHHMEPEPALRKASALLREGGILLVVGLAKPSGLGDLLLEGLRVLPSAAVTRLHSARSPETLGVPVSYALPPMPEVRALTRRLLPGAALRPALHYRYLLRWTKK